MCKMIMHYSHPVIMLPFDKLGHYNNKIFAKIALNLNNMVSVNRYLITHSFRAITATDINTINFSFPRFTNRVMVFGIKVMGFLRCAGIMLRVMELKNLSENENHNSRNVFMLVLVLYLTLNSYFTKIRSKL